MVMQRYFSAREIARFWSFVDNTGVCWVWTGDCFRGGYGRFSFWVGKRRVKSFRAHIYSFALHTKRYRGVLVRPKTTRSSYLVCHSCDTPGCVNPKHLWLGSQRQNVADMDAKGRRVVCDFSGEKNPMWGKTHTAETRNQIARKLLGRKLSVETRKKMSDAHRRRLCKDANLQAR